MKPTHSGALGLALLLLFPFQLALAEVDLNRVHLGAAMTEALSGDIDAMEAELAKIKHQGEHHRRIVQIRETGFAQVLEHWRWRAQYHFEKGDLDAVVFAWKQAEQFATQVGIPLDHVKEIRAGDVVRAITSLMATPAPDGHIVHLGKAFSVKSKKTQRMPLPVLGGIAHLKDKKRSASKEVSPTTTLSQVSSIPSLTPKDETKLTHTTKMILLPTRLRSR